MSIEAEAARGRLIRGDLLPYVVGGLTIFILVAFLLYPILKTVLASFVVSGKPVAWQNLTTENFTRFFEAGTYQDAFLNSATVGLLVTAVSVALALPAAYAVSRVAMPFRNLILALSVIPLIAPPFIGAYSWVILLGHRGIVTYYLVEWFGLQVPSIYGLFGIVLALSFHYFPYVLLFVQGALTAGDPAIEESAQVMGASRTRVLRTITFPLVIPTISAGALIVLVKTLGNFGVPAILGGEYYVLPTLIYYQVNGYFNLNGASAIALVNVAITIVAIWILTLINKKQKFITVTSLARRAKLQTTLGIRVLANVYVWTLLVFALLPQALVVFMSFAEVWGGTLLPTVYGFGNYKRLMGDLGVPIMNSLLLAGLATLMCIVFGTVAAYTASRRGFFAKWSLDLTIMLPFVLPGIVTGVAYLTTFNTGILVLTGTGTIIVLAYFIRRIAYIFRSVTASVGQLDSGIEEASRMCGAGWAQTMRKITIPLIAPGIVAGGILVFSTLITEISVTILLYSASWKTIAIAIFEQLTNEDIFGAGTIGSFAILLTLVLVFAASKIAGKSMAELFR